LGSTLIRENQPFIIYLLLKSKKKLISHHFH
jgi:hypothetical protein